MKRRSYSYTAVICQPNGHWFHYEGTFGLNTRNGKATPNQVPMTALETARRAYPRAVHIFITKHRATGPAATVEEA